MTEIVIKIDVDECIASEIRELNDKGINTRDSCCGHGDSNMSYITVRDIDREKMLQLGYVQMKNSTFKPKSECNCTPIVKVYRCLNCKNHFEEQATNVEFCPYCGKSEMKIEEIYMVIKVLIFSNIETQNGDI